MQSLGEIIPKRRKCSRNSAVILTGFVWRVDWCDLRDLHQDKEHLSVEFSGYNVKSLPRKSHFISLVFSGCIKRQRTLGIPECCS